MSELAHRVIPHDTLLETGRVNRQPLRRWARELVARLASARERLTDMTAQPEAWTDIAGCMNNAALIEVFRGDPRNARALCELQLYWIQGLVRTHGLAAACHLALQPWVNIGRLLRSAGDQARALAHFSILVDTQARKDLHIGPVTIDAATWQGIAQVENMAGFLDAVYVVESWKTYMAARDHVGAVDFVRSASARTGAGVSMMRAELEAIALAKLGHHDQALAVTDRPEWQQDGYAKLVRVTYRVALMIAAGHVRQALRPLEQLAERVLSSNLGAAQDPRVLRYLHQLGLIARSVELAGPAARAWRAGLHLSRQLADVPLELAFLDSLLELEELEDRVLLAEQRTELLRDCLYVSLLAPRGLAMMPGAAADPIFAELDAMLHEAAEGMHRSSRARVA